VDEEILVREGIALGLDRDDPVIRRRLRQKMEYLHVELGTQQQATDAELTAFLSENQQRFEVPARLSFKQVFVSPEAGSAEARRRASEILASLQSGVPDPAVEGDSTLLPAAMAKASEREIGSVFGADFAADVFALTRDDWSGPVASNYGLHLVRVGERVAARKLELEEARREVERDYQAARRAEANQRFLEDLRERYEVEIRKPAGDSAAQPSALGG
jgi:parvulin-like peptidyl-prolyl isomerase